MIKDRIKKLDWVNWRDIKDLQPKNLKQMFNYQHIENSIRKHGFAFPFGVWQDKKGDIYAIDGHTRIEVLSSMEDAPEKLPAFFIDAKSRKEAISILLEVYNQRTNPIDDVVLREFLEVEEIAVESIAVSSLNIIMLSDPNDDYYNVKKGESKPNEAGPKSTDDDYSVFELVMLHENKLILLQVLNEVKARHGIDKQEDALMYIINNHK